jgi:signal transduction histidine kinase
VLTAAGLRLDELVRRVEGDDGDSASSARDVRELIRHALDRTRRLSFELYPPQLDQRGLGAALDALGHQFETESTFEVAVSVVAARFPRAVEQLVFRTIKELLTNARKHSEARHVTVAVTSETAAVSCVVEDDGLGFDPDAVAVATRGFHIGLVTAAERVRSAGGRLEIASVPNLATRATFTVPFRVGDH